MDPTWVRTQARRQHKDIPDSLEGLWRGDLRSFEDFIDAFLFIASLLRDREAIREAVRSIATRTRTAGGRGFDLWCSPHWLVVQEKQLPLGEFWRGLEEGLTEARASGLASAVVIDAVNHFGIDHGHEVVDLIRQDLPDYVVGFSTGGLERVPFRDWAPVFDRARQLGLRIAAHAGENGHPNNVREAILEGGVSRIVHGVRSDDATLHLLHTHAIPVDICLSSNRILVPSLGEHPLPRMLRAGVRCALGTDDPGIIPCSLDTEEAEARRLGLTEDELQQLWVHGEADAWCLQGRDA
jgi:adenosine deaminase